jgi:AcrR family transcriptional regulator
MSPQRQVRPSNRRELILSAAAELFSVRGFAAVSVDDIGSGAGTSGPALYRHFSNKEALLETLLLQTVEKLTPSPSIDRDHAAFELEIVSRCIENPAQVATYVRERERLVGPAKARLTTMERRLYMPWAAVVLDASPSLDPKRIQQRQHAAITALLGVSTQLRSSGNSGRVWPAPEFQAQLANSVSAMLRAAPAKKLAPSPRNTSWRPPEQRRQMILHEALRLFRERGFHDVRMDEIGESAGISGPTVYFYYPSKADVLLDAYELAGALVMAGVYDALTSAASSWNAIERLVCSYVRVATEKTDLMVVTSREAYAIPTSERPRLARRRQDIWDAWTSVVGEVRGDITRREARSLAAGGFALITSLASRGVFRAEIQECALTFFGGGI